MKTQIVGMLALALVVPWGCDAQRSRTANADEMHKVAAGPNIAIPSQFASLPLVEPHISAHPANSKHLLVAAMVVTDIKRPYESCRLVSFVSVDGGASWKETVHNWWGYDPWTAIAGDGTTVMSWIGTEGSFQDKYPVQLFSSADGGVTWSTKVQTLPGMHDGTKLIEWNSRFYFTTVRFSESEGADVVLFSRTGDNGFMEQGLIDGNGARLNFCEPAVTSTGTVIVPAASREAAWVQHFDPVKPSLSSSKTIAKRPGNWRGYARLVSDTHQGSSYSDYVYFLRAMGNSGLIVNRSKDGGETWDPDLRTDLFSRSSSNALVPSAAVNVKGVVGISWVNQNEDKSGSEVFFTASFDGGVSFIAPVRLTSVVTDPRTSKNDDVANKFPGGGHYLGLAARADGSFQAVWSDSRNEVFQLQTCTIRLVD